MRGAHIIPVDRADGGRGRREGHVRDAGERLAAERIGGPELETRQRAWRRIHRSDYR